MGDADVRADPTTPAERLEVEDAITTLFIATDEKDWVGVRACLADEVLFDMSSLSGAPAATMSADSIVEAWKQGLAPIQAIHHQVGNFRVCVHGEEAVATCYGIAYHYRPNFSGRNTRVFVGTYDFHLKCGWGKWRIDRFRFQVKFVDGNLELEKM
ncbi:MAG TPA: nuclear transport factor 2 family protein [Candidatus Omnitrophota bacterium]|nr:nuclear transport factor 2 family protein [Candidatus Omnitrophota bacterium]